MERILKEEVVGLPRALLVRVGKVLEAAGRSWVPRGLAREVARLRVELSKALGRDDQLADPSPINQHGNVGLWCSQAHVGHEAVLMPRDGHVVSLSFVAVSLVPTWSQTR